MKQALVLHLCLIWLRPVNPYVQISRDNLQNFLNVAWLFFTCRARVRQGLRITGARMSDPSSQWSIQVDIKEHQKTGTVTAFVRDPDTYKKSAK